MISLNINSLFTNAPLHDTIDTFLRRIYINKEIITNLTKKELNLHQRCSPRLILQKNGMRAL